jgi:hypothetical protein
MRQALNPKLIQNVTSAEMKSDPGFLPILLGFSEDEVGDFCRIDEAIQMIGYKHYLLGLHDERDQEEMTNSIMTDMREVTKLYFSFRRALSCSKRTVEDMFKEKHLPDLLEAMKELVNEEDEEEERDGRSCFLKALLLRSVKVLERFYSHTKQNDQKKELKNFEKAFRNSSLESDSSGSYPSKQEVLQVKEYIAAEILTTLRSYSIKDFEWLKSLVVARLTLYNARRGKDAAGILFSEWEHVEKGSRISERRVEKITDPAEEYLSGKFVLAHLKEKRKQKFVPVLIPNDLLSAIRVIGKEMSKYGMREDTPFLFATNNGSSSHSSGWHAVAEVCDIKGACLNTEREIRDRLSCIYTSLDMSPENQKKFLQRMGYEDQDAGTENCHNPTQINAADTNNGKPSSGDEGNIFFNPAQFIVKWNDLICCIIYCLFTYMWCRDQHFQNL